MLESIIKLVIIFVLLIAVIFYWVLPRTRFASRLRLTEPVFIVTNIIGILVGLIGLIAVIVMPERIITAHLWELIALPYALVWGYWLIIIRIKKSTAITDEKQELDLSKAGAMTMASSIIILAFVFNLDYNEIFRLNNGLWFPFYLFLSITLFSVFTILFYKKN